MRNLLVEGSPRFCKSGQETKTEAADVTRCLAEASAASIAALSYSFTLSP